MKFPKLTTLGAGPFLMLAVAFSFSNSAQALPDKIGNGAGVWVCENPAGDMFDIMFMDIFEAQREYQLQVPDRTENYTQLVQEQKSWIKLHLQNADTLIPHIEYVEKNITWIDDIINLIPDGANKISPHPSTCRQGHWDAVQLVNFTEDFRILVRRDLFNSTMLNEVERAAVYLHEGIYSYLRTEFQDTTSVRTRAIVGFLFSNLPDDEKVLRINKVLSQTPNTPPPTPAPAQGWVCGLKPTPDAPLYIAEDITDTKARAAVVESCKKGENKIPDFPTIPTFPGIPNEPGFDGFPGFPGGGFPLPSPPSECKESVVSCEQILSSSSTAHQCELPRFNQQSYIGHGRTLLEARRDAMNQCMVSEGSPSCYINTSDMKCR